VCVWIATISGDPGLLLQPEQEDQVLNKTIIALTAAVALGCVPLATNALAAGHPGGHGGGHASGGHAMGHARAGHGARYGGGYNRGGYYGGDYYGGGAPIYDSCGGGYYGPGYGCPGYGVPLVGGVINGILGGYDSY
jgi:hypothetical protein